MLTGGSERLRKLALDQGIRKMAAREVDKQCVCCGLEKAGMLPVPETSQKAAGARVCADCVGWLVDAAIDGRKQAERQMAREAKRAAPAPVAFGRRRRVH